MEWGFWNRTASPPPPEESVVCGGERQTSPRLLTVRDLGELIHGQYAIISGGKTRDGHPIITFPDCGNFGQLTDEEYRKLVLYLTAVPPLQDGDLGFVLVVDRRNDKWTAVKTALVRIAGFFPGVISCVYVLRPCSFFQKAISEVSCKIFKDEFKFKVVVCSSDAELHEYINKDQLTEELGGTAPYCHEEWIEQRVALERFSASTQDIGSALRKFTQKLQDAELPNDVQRTQELLAVQSAEYGVLKADLLSASRHGESLLACIRKANQDLLNTTASNEADNNILLSHGMKQQTYTNRRSVADTNPPQQRVQLDTMLDQTNNAANSHHHRSSSSSAQYANSSHSGQDQPFSRMNSSEGMVPPQTLRASERRTSYQSQGNNSTDKSVNATSKDKATSSPVNVYSSVDRLTYVTAVERLLVQLEETEATFDDFWLQHHTRLTQCLQLRRFEADFKEVQGELSARQQEATVLPSLGDSAQQVQERLQLTHRFNDLVRDILDRAAELRSSGQQLIASQHYAVDSLRPKCGELTRAAQQLEEVIATTRSRLERCYHLHQSIDRANDWCTEGVELLASQQLERCQSADVALQAVRKLEVFLGSAQHRSLSGGPLELFTGHDDVSTPETRGLLQQIVKRMQDVELMCEKRLSSLQKMVTQLSRPVNVVSPEPATTLLYSQQLQQQQYPQDRSKPGLLRNGSEGCLMKGGGAASTMQDNLSLGGKLDDQSSLNGEVTSANRNKRSLVLKELLDTERIYVSELCSVLRGYKDDMMNPDLQYLIPIELYGKSDILFGNLEQIYLFHSDVFLRDLENCIDTTELIGLCFVQRKETFHHLYSLYCQNKPASEELRRMVGDNNLYFSECQRKLCHKLPLGAYLLKPVQRITKYQLLLKDLLQCVEGHDGRAELQEGVDTMLAVLKCLNDSMHQVAITAFPGNLSDLGKLLMQGPFSVWMENKRVLRDLRIKPAQRHLFLFEKGFLFTKRTGKDNDKASYQFKCALKMSQVGLTESVRGNKGDLRKFEVWLQGRQEVHTILAPSVEVKDLWVKEIKRVLLEQFEYLKGENIKQYSARIHKGTSLNGIRPPQSPTAQHRALRQTASWDVGGAVIGNGLPFSLSSSASNPDGGVGMGVIPINGPGMKAVRANSKTSLHSTLDFTEETHLEEDEGGNWSSEYSASEDEEDPEMFAGGHEMSSKFLVLADYNAMGPSEVSLREGDLVELVKVGCAGWWYVRVCSMLCEGWAPAAYLERVLRKTKGSTPSVSSQDSSTGLHHATSRTSVASLSSKSEEVACEKWAT